MPSAMRERLQLWSARRAGKSEGKRGIPLPEESEIPPYGLTAIRQRAEEELFELERSYVERDRAPKAAYTATNEKLARVRSEVKAKQADFGRHEGEREAEEKADRALLAKLDDERRAALRIEDPAADKSAPKLEPTHPVEPTKAEPAQPKATVRPSIPAGPVPAAAMTESKNDEEPRPLDQIATDEAHSHAQVGIRPFAYWCVITLVILGEIPLNSIAFRLFGESNALTYVMTFSVAVILIAVAHFLGSLLAKDHLSIRDRVLSSLISLAVILALMSIGVIRTKFLLGRGDSDVTLRFLGPIFSTLTFVTINALIFLGAMALSILKHDPHTVRNREAADRSDHKREKTRLENQRELKEAEEQARLRARAKHSKIATKQREKEDKARQERRDRELQNKEREDAHRRDDFEQRKRLEDSSFTERDTTRSNHRASERRQLSIAEGELDRLEASVENLKAEREMLAESTKADAKRIRKYFERVMSAYCAANVRARKDRVTPPVLRSLPEITIPDELSQVVPEWV